VCFCHFVAFVPLSLGPFQCRLARFCLLFSFMPPLCVFFLSAPSFSCLILSENEVLFFDNFRQQRPISLPLEPPLYVGNSPPSALCSGAECFGFSLPIFLSSVGESFTFLTLPFPHLFGVFLTFFFIPPLPKVLDALPLFPSFQTTSSVFHLFQHC